MGKYLQIQINEPCLENWDNMKDVGAGRHCGACRKTVIDFTLMSDNDLVDFFKKNPANVCGRLTQQQLQTDHLIPAKKIPWLKYFFQVAIPAFLFSSKVIAQGTIRVIEKHVVDKKKVKTFFPIERAEIKCETNVLPPLVTETILPLEQLSGWLRALCIVRIEKYRPGIIENILRPASTNEFTIYPNPVISGSALNIKWKNPVRTYRSIEIFNQNGNVVQQQNVSLDKRNAQLELKLIPLLPGTYIIRITDNKTRQAFSQQFVVQ